MWLFELFPLQRHIVEAKSLSMGKTLDSFCMKRDGKVVNKAPPCSKSDLKKMMLYLYENASSAIDDQDAALLCLLWYLFGRASDLSLVLKQSLSVDAGKVFFVRFIPMKTPEEQGLSLFPDADFVTYSSDRRLDRQLALRPFRYCCKLASVDAAVGGPQSSGRFRSTRTLSFACKNFPSSLSNALTSPSFRRGGAQHVNGCDGLTQRWIFGRGGWNMSKTNKG
ncbi:Hypothetical protein PHPALM_3878 [Phytophthora palmivora]|uniref:Uncharacterized protein n=1 Tax=Phytophthora palmivora TaxID=4796 RepID=A0A2P4YL99_9STRA|nr:Hypothetical protein PHPALM_3878 [Phytophthora palmivora]